MLLAAAAVAGPSQDVKKSYYTTPIKEFKGAAFFQWKKFQPAVTGNAVATDRSASQTEPVQADKNTRAADKAAQPVSASTKKD